MFHTLLVVMASWVYAHVQIHQDVHYMCVIFCILIVLQSSFKKENRTTRAGGEGLF